MTLVPPVAVESVWEWLADVPDPEVPAVSVVDLGIVRDLAWSHTAEGNALLEVTITPTYTGCPATAVIGRDIVRALHDHGVREVRLQTQLDPPWTTDWLSEAAREKLRAYGIAPPVGSAAGPEVFAFASARSVSVACPRCGSQETSRTSEFGSTPCKALYRCNACAEPFDYFKCH
ncbi:MAG: phenylacetate-CoA oxygenase subunit PaaJ [Candidatus Eremiobacteraeota bacterium]|nr:phenylacetate-CoA oxygenase subunit PaaJ [Candidatus Eremiobacteraeota bacterium]